VNDSVKQKIVSLQLTSFIASAVDFVITAVSESVFQWNYIFANSVGTFSGGAVNFYLNRAWIFRFPEEKGVVILLMRYAAVWTGSFFLNGTGTFLFTEYLNFQYMVSKLIVSVTIGLTYNQYLQRYFVFRIPHAK
jgi:putative flippase GtrA